MMNKTLFIRADADTSMGTGHVMRCIALGQEWRRACNGQVTFLSRIDSSSLKERIKLEGFRLVEMPLVYPDSGDACFIEEVLAEHNAEAPLWLVLDGYHFDSAYQKKIHREDRRILVIDDNAQLPEYHCNILLNHNLHSEQLDYHGDAGMVCLLGPKYALLRSEFREAGKLKREIPPVARKVLVTLGGGDQRNATALVLEALAEAHIPDLQVKAVIGTANPHQAGLSELIARLPFSSALIPPTTDMAGLMQWAEAAVTAAGTTTYELAACGLPFAALVIADNQEKNAAELAKRGLSINLGRPEGLSPSQLGLPLRNFLHDDQLRLIQSRTGQALVDGKGAACVVSAMQYTGYSFRPVRWEDRNYLLEWVNDPQTRKNSFNSESIAKKDHENWLRAKLISGDCHMVIAANQKDIPMGVVRFEMEEDKAIISINIAPSFRWKGLGSRIIADACDGFFHRYPASAVEARVKLENLASLSVFEEAGFSVTGRTLYGDVPAVILHRYRLKREPDRYAHHS